MYNFYFIAVMIIEIFMKFTVIHLVYIKSKCNQKFKKHVIFILFYEVLTKSGS